MVIVWSSRNYCNTNVVYLFHWSSKKYWSATGIDKIIKPMVMNCNEFENIFRGWDLCHISSFSKEISFVCCGLLACFYKSYRFDSVLTVIDNKRDLELRIMDHGKLRKQLIQLLWASRKHFSNEHMCFWLPHWDFYEA